MIKAYLKDSKGHLRPVTIINTLLNDEGVAVAIFIDHERNIIDDMELWGGKDYNFVVNSNDNVALADRAGLLDAESLNELRDGQ